MLLDLFLPRHAAILALSSHPYGTGGAHDALEQPQNTQKPEYVFGSVFGSGAAVRGGLARIVLWPNLPLPKVGVTE